MKNYETLGFLALSLSNVYLDIDQFLTLALTVILIVIAIVNLVTTIKESFKNDGKLSKEEQEEIKFQVAEIEAFMKELSHKNKE